MDDALSALLHEVRSHGALFDQAVVRPPWAFRFEEGTRIAVLAMLSGRAWISRPDGAGAPVPLGEGELAIVVGPQAYVVADDPGTAPRYLVDEDERCTTPDGALVLDSCTPGCRAATGPRDGRDDAVPRPVLLRGAYRLGDAASARLADALPRIARVSLPPGGAAVLETLAEEIHRSAPGRQAVLDRLLDLLLVSGLRAWFERPEASAPDRYRAHGDPVVGRALRLLHEDPARPWTVASLAAEVGASRAGFARRFTQRMGGPPMGYLTQWRIGLAADLLARTDETVEAVSRRVGYANAYALSVAFKRVRGVRPTEHRARSRTA
ncbi:cupin domain-containing protein [Streptomyces sp. NPDC002454]|uniref:AraC family transcriptional regulator n=1 Tax=Streptomyces sp. NPDC002490 TaxID=3154416 RepID=UPI00333345CE